MRILHVGYDFLPLRHGGVIRYTHDLMDEQLAGGHAVGYFFAGRQSPVGPRDCAVTAARPSGVIS